MTKASLSAPSSDASNSPAMSARMACTTRRSAASTISTRRRRRPRRAVPSRGALAPNGPQSPRWRGSPRDVRQSRGARERTTPTGRRHSAPAPSVSSMDGSCGPMELGGPTASGSTSAHREPTPPQAARGEADRSLRHSSLEAAGSHSFPVKCGQVRSSTRAFVRLRARDCGSARRRVLTATTARAGLAMPASVRSLGPVCSQGLQCRASRACMIHVGLPTTRPHRLEQGASAFPRRTKMRRQTRAAS
jgi:hypothetical protein